MLCESTIIKKLIILSFFLFFLGLKAQENDEKNIRLGFDVTPKMGTAVLMQSDRVKVNGNVNAGDVLFYCDLGKSKFSVGVGLLNFLADGTHQGKEYFLSQSYMRIIPLRITNGFNIFESWSNNGIQIVYGVGMYINTLIIEKLETIDIETENKKSSWNSGISLNLGVNFNVSKYIDFGIGYETGGDISSLKKNDTKSKLRAISTINFNIGIKL